MVQRGSGQLGTGPDDHPKNDENTPSDQGKGGAKGAVAEMTVARAWHGLKLCQLDFDQREPLVKLL